MEMFRGKGMVLFVSDLDNTLIYSYRKMVGERVCVEMKEGKELSYMTPAAYSLLQEVNKKTVFVPVTTRSIEQYKRIDFFNGRRMQNGFIGSVPKYALTSNGGILLVDDKIDPIWQKETIDLIQDAVNELDKALDLLKRDPYITLKARLVDDVFIFAKTKNMAYSQEMLRQVCNLQKVYIDSNGEKLYVFPKILDKGLAVKRFLKKYPAQAVIAAGDSAFDIPMLLVANQAVIPSVGIDGNKFFHKHHIYCSKREGQFFGEEILEKVICFIETEF